MQGFKAKISLSLARDSFPAFIPKVSSGTEGFQHPESQEDSQQTVYRLCIYRVRPQNPEMGRPALSRGRCAADQLPVSRLVPAPIRREKRIKKHCGRVHSERMLLAYHLFSLHHQNRSV